MFFLILGRRKVANRLKFQTLLRKLYNRPYKDVDEKKLNTVIEIACTLGGSVLQMDIKIAKKYLIQLKKWLSNLVICQKVGRGYIVRNRIARKKEKEERHRLYVLKVTETIQLLSSSYVDLILKKSIQNLIKVQMKPYLKVAALMSGIYVIVSIHRRSRYSRKHEELRCEVCNTRTQYYQKRQQQLSKQNALEQVRYTSLLRCYLNVWRKKDKYLTLSYSDFDRLEYL